MRFELSYFDVLRPPDGKTVVICDLVQGSEGHYFKQVPVRTLHVNVVLTSFAGVCSKNAKKMAACALNAEWLGATR